MHANTRPITTVFTSALALVLLLTPVFSEAQLENTRPNIIFIFSDDHAPHAISAYGSTINQTPNIDRIAEEGAIFTRSYCGNSICGPSRATILTGLHSHGNGFMRNGHRFDGNQQTFPQLLQKSGYQTALIGKWHLSSDPVGFDHWMILPGQGNYYNPDFITPDGRIRIEGHVTDITTDLAIKWLEEDRDGDKPFMMMFQHKAPHRAWMPAPEELNLYDGEMIPEPATLFDDYAGRGKANQDQAMEIDRHMFFAYDLFCPLDEDEALYNAYENLMDRMTDEQRKAWDEAMEAENEAFRAAMGEMSHEDIVRWKYQRYIKNYLRCVAGVDRNVGRVLDYLDANPELKENTVVIYSSDQGFFLGDHGWYDKRWMYEESFAMPLVMRWPGKIAPGTKIEQLVQNIDYAPTFLALAGAEADTPMHGKSLLPLVDSDPDNNQWRDALYYRYYMHPGTHNVAQHYGVATERYKLMYFLEKEYDYWELYDLESDPDELTNVYDDPAYAEIVDGLKTRLTELQAEYNDNSE